MSTSLENVLLLGLCVRTSRLTWRTTGRGGAPLLRALRLHLMSGSVAGSAPRAFLRTLLMHLMTWRLARYTLSKHGWCGSHENRSRERDDLCFHVVLLQISLQISPGLQRNEPQRRSMNGCS